MLLALSLIVLASRIGDVATVTLRADGDTVPLRAASAYLEVPPSWVLRSLSTPEPWQTLTAVSDTGRTLVWLSGSVPAPTDLAVLVYDAPVPGCVRFAPTQGECVPSALLDGNLQDVTSERINSCEVVCPGDRNGDGLVGVDDLTDVLANTGCSASLNDLTRLLSHYGTSCP